MRCLLYVLICLAAGKLLALIAGNGVPAAVIGMLLLAGLLSLTGGPDPVTRRCAAFIHRHLTLLFVPAGVGLITFVPLLSESGLIIALCLAVSTLSGMAVTALVLGGARNGDQE